MAGFLKHLHPHIVEVDIIFGNSGLELCISLLAGWIPAFPHMIEITILDSLSVGVRHPPVDDPDPELIGSRLSWIKGHKIFTRCSHIEK